MILDASAWIELLDQTDNYERVYNTIDSEACYTCITTMSELLDWALRNNHDAAQIVEMVEGLSEPLHLDRETALFAGRLNFERKASNKKWGIMDSFVLATAIKYKFQILTKDSDFKDRPEAVML